MTACIYARYSIDNQSPTSLADQFRVCGEWAARNDIEVSSRHGDEGISGATPVASRPGGRALLADLLSCAFDVLIVEGLDRLSRDIVEQEQIVRRCEHRGIRIVGVADGYDSTMGARKIMRGVRGLINEIYLDDLRHKTHRGLAGQVERGMHAGSVSYGYRSVPADGGHRLEVVADQAAIVREIFARWVDGWSIRRIALDLNARRVPSPRGNSWCPSALYGSPNKGSGVLNNRLYLGEYIWNRSKWVKDPDTGKRHRHDRPQHEWMIDTRPELQIVDVPLWQAAQARIGRTANAGRGRSPRTLFSGLLRCPHCGGPVSKLNGSQYGCSTARDRGPNACSSTDRFDFDAVSARMLSIVQTEVASASALAEVERAAAALMTDAARETKQQARQATARRAELEKEIGRLVDAVAASGGSPALLARLQSAEAALASLPTPSNDLCSPHADHVRAAVLEYKALVLRLRETLESDVDVARELLQQLLGRVEIYREGDEVWVRGANEAPAQGIATGTDGYPKMVAGARNSIWKRPRRLL